MGDLTNIHNKVANPSELAMGFSNAASMRIAFSFTGGPGRDITPGQENNKHDYTLDNDGPVI